MAYQSLYRRYRPQRFAEVRGQEHLVKALRNAVAEDRVGHAYLLSGPRGTGKTSTARVLAKALNCPDVRDGEPCGQCESCLAIEAGRSFDLQELDAASNRGIAEMKALLETIALGTPGRTKVYILDEVHMLTKEASAALLKTLEEPPAHVVFVLATTDPQKVLPTIRSRTQHFQLHLLPADELAALVDEVAAAAGIELTDDQREYVLKKGGGSARDTLSVLDQVAAAGAAPETADAIDPLVDALVDGDPGAAFAAVQLAITAGREPRALGEHLIDELRDAFLAAMKVDLPHRSEAALERATDIGRRWGARSLTRALEAIGEALVEMRQASDPRIPLELALLRITRPEADESLDAVLQRLDRLERALSGGAAAPATPPAAAAARTTEPSEPPPPPSSGGGRGRPADSARRILADRQGSAPSRPAPGPDAAPAEPGDAPAPDAPSVEAPPAAPASGRGASRPALGAHRSRRARGSGGDAAPSGEPPAAGSTTTEEAPATAPAGGDPASDPPAVPSARSGPASTEPLAGLAELAGAWKDAVLPVLRQGTRARWAPGRFVDVTAEAAVYGLDNQITCDRCEEGRAEVEAALAAHFGRPIPVRLVIHGDGAGGARAGSSAPEPALDPETELAAIGPIDELEDAPDATDGISRLTQAFPGAELVETEADDR